MLQKKCSVKKKQILPNTKEQSAVESYGKNISKEYEKGLKPVGQKIVNNTRRALETRMQLETAVAYKNHKAIDMAGIQAGKFGATSKSVKTAELTDGRCIYVCRKRLSKKILYKCLK